MCDSQDDLLQSEVDGRVGPNVEKGPNDWSGDSMSSFRDVQEEEPKLALKIDRVGIRGARKKVVIYTPKGELQFDVVLDAYVDLPVTKRGAHMSRNIEAFVEAIEETRKKKFATLEEILLNTCRGLLQKHPHANRAEISAKTCYYFEENFTGSRVSQPADVTISTILDRKGEDKRRVAVSVLGMTVCPSAQQMFHETEKTPLAFAPSHTQRARLQVGAVTRERFVRIEHLIKAARRAFSAPTVDLLKKPDEHTLIRHAFERPRFIEDLVRHALYNLYRTLLEDGYPSDSILHVEAESYESVHPHNTFACRTVTLGELIEEEKRKI